jgi:hypothetical protein
VTNRQIKTCLIFLIHEFVNKTQTQEIFERNELKLSREETRNFFLLKLDHPFCEMHLNF